MDIEVEIKCFISKENYQRLLDFFKSNAEFINEDYQETYYFNSVEDLRIQRNNSFCKIVLKSGKIHDYHRKELEIKLDKNDFEKLEKLFNALGYEIEIKWFRKRNNFKWQYIDVSLDFTKGYGYILELEKMSNEENKEKNLLLLREKLKLLGVNETRKEEFDKIFENYKKNWKELTKD